MRTKSFRRWKTLCKHKKRHKFLSRAWGTETPSVGGLEDPKLCSCMLCSPRNGYTARPKKRKMRNGERKAIREYYKESS